LDETHSVTTIANDEFDFELPHNNNKHNQLISGIQKQLQHHQQQDMSTSTHVSLYESASMNDLDSVSVKSCHHHQNNTTRLYKKNSKFKNEKKVFRRVQSCESIPNSGGVLIISDVNDEWL